jgi:hypothetical protein
MVDVGMTDPKHLDEDALEIRCGIPRGKGESTRDQDDPTSRMQNAT